MLHVKRLTRTVGRRWQTPVKWFYCAIAFCVLFGSALLLIAWCVDAKQFWSNALVEFGAALLTIAFTALAIDWAIAERDRHGAWIVWKESRDFALLESRRQIQRLVFASLHLLPPSQIPKTVHLWDSVSLRNDDQLRSLMQTIGIQLGILIMKRDEYSDDYVDELLSWLKQNRDVFDQFGTRLMPLLVAAHCPQPLLALLAQVLYDIQSMWWSFEGLEYGRREGRATLGQTAECIGTVRALLTHTGLLHERVCLELDRTDG